MVDEDTLMVGYRHWRGEPRGKMRKGALDPNQGDCIDCMACVNVCPVGIDIREGQQLECITCALCIDACDEVMDRIGKPRGLIDYMALTDEPLEVAGQPPKAIWKHIFRPRTLMYTAIWGAVGLGLVFALFVRPDIDMTVAPVRNPTYVTLSDGAIRNIYDVRLRNKHGETRPFHITITGDDALTVTVEGAPDQTVLVSADATQMQRVYVVAPKGSAASVAERSSVTLWITDQINNERASVGTVFNGKGQ
jgi:cytochrome c oxidase accessory protein FixG